ncbi:hypothetical protein MAR_035947 [Mya arenaria]|uniref:Uncharacterized protein n=1 Tax=Mya arenaria TaxID=6604 RepID=A0ABY7EUJ1_MYAAR|nr:hypothetical protein MAR_035947 [Mya arenaria]
MPAVDCPIPGCVYQTPDMEATIVAALLTAHSAVHMSPTNAAVVEKADAVPDDYPMEIDPPEYSSVSTSYHRHEPTDPPPSYDELYRDRPVAHRSSESTISTAENPDPDPVTVANPDSDLDQDLDRITAAYPVQSGDDACWQKFPFLCVICGIVVPFAGPQLIFQ